MEPAIFAAVGDVHGQIAVMVDLLLELEKTEEVKIEFVLQTGDFEPHRNTADLQTMAAPQKYRKVGDFASFMNGNQSFPWPVYFIGGNHEPYGYLDEDPAGFELMPRCTYLGRAYAGTIGGLKVCGLTGIFSEKHFTEPRPPLSAIGSTSNKEYTYFRTWEVERLLGEDSADVLLLHEWPSGILEPEGWTVPGSRGPGSGGEAPGNKYARWLLDHLRPKLVLCGHLHHRYRRRLRWEDGSDTLFAGLAHIGAGMESVALFSYDGGEIKERLVGAVIPKAIGPSKRNFPPSSTRFSITPGKKGSNRIAGTVKEEKHGG